MMVPTQEVIAGEHCLEQLGGILKEKQCDTIFLITGKHFLIEPLPVWEGLTILHHFIKNGPNVADAEIDKAISLYREFPAHAIVAIGGGSVIDLAKCIIHDCVTVHDMLPPFAVAPTTIGSGSEATSFAVVYKKQKKISLVHEKLLPSLVLLDPVLTYSLSPYQAAVSGMDTLAQAIESYWNKNANKESIEFATEAIGLWKEHFSAAVKGNKTSRCAMQQAAYTAGKAIAITRTTGPHALSYFLTARYNVPHGHAVALLLPVFFKYNDIPDGILSLLEVAHAGEAISFLQETMQEAGLAIHLEELNIDKDSVLDQLLDEVNEERFANNPAPFDRQRLYTLLKESL